MSDINKLDLGDLEQVAGGANAVVNNTTVDYANIREQPGLNSLILAQVKNGTKLVTTGKSVKKDGYNWLQVYLATGSDPGWVAESLLKF